LRLHSTLLVLATLLPSAIAQDPDTSVETVFEGLNYREVGPYRGGRSAAVAGLPANRDIYYMGTAGGGVWKTGNAGRSWDNVSDGFFGGSIGAVAVSEWDPNVVYVGGGEKTVRGNVSHGDGMWRSVDAGETWKHVGLSESRHISRIRIHPRDPDLAYAAVMGHLFGPNEERGVFRTKDGGATWERILHVSDEVGAVDLAMDPTNPRILYSCFWRILRTPYSLESGGEGCGVWKSTDGGDSWTELTGNPGLPKGLIGISGITVSKADPKNLYLILESEEGGVFRSRDGGDTWSKTSSSRSLRQRAWYYSRLYADPVDVDKVYVLNVSFHVSKDGGKSFSTISVPHGDNHDLWIDPADPKRMIQSNDGGSNISFDGGKSWTDQEGQPTSQMYRVSTDNAFPYRLMGGQQDNSTVRIRSRNPDGGSIDRTQWSSTAGGESGHVVAHPNDPDIVFGGSYGGYLSRRNHRTGERRTVSVWPDNPLGWGAGDLKYRFNWNFPLSFSPHAPHALYAGANVLFRSMDEGQTWEQISGDLTRNEASKLGASGGPITKDNTSVEYYCTLFAVAESPHEKGVIWCASDDGVLSVTRDDGKTWSTTTAPDMPEWTMINSVEVHPTEPGGLYVAGTRYKLDDFEPYLFRTLDYGATWTRIDSGIDRLHFTRALRADPGRPGLLYAGTERGVYVSFDDGGNWEPMQLDLPVVPVTDLAVKNGDLVVATQGRGYWILDDLSPLHQWDPGAHAGQAVLFEPRDAYRLSGGGWGGSGKSGKNPASGVVVNYQIPTDLDEGTEIRIDILDAAGELVMSFTPKPGEGDDTPKAKYAAEDVRKLDVEPGMHRFAWNLRYPGAESFDDMILWNGGMRGPRAVPGKYEVKLVVGESSASVPATVLADPRSGAQPADFQAQFDFLIQVRNDLTRAHKAIRQLRRMRGELGDLRGRVDDDESSVCVAAQELEDALTEIEKELYQTQNQARQDPLNFPIRLTDKLSGLSGVVGTGDNAPTAQAHAVREDLTGRIEIQLKMMGDLLDEQLPVINRLAREADLPAVSSGE
jgi:photosystem II stability/assembly factor-like uncharacterized protein